MLQTDTKHLFPLRGIQCMSTCKELFYLPSPLVWPCRDQKPQPALLSCPLPALLQALQALFGSIQGWWFSRQQREIKHKQSVKDFTNGSPGFRRTPRYLSQHWNELGHWLQPQHWTGFPHFVQCSKLQIILTGILDDPGMLLLSSSYVNLPGINLSLSRMKPVIWYCHQSYFTPK